MKKHFIISGLVALGCVAAMAESKPVAHFTFDEAADSKVLSDTAGTAQGEIYDVGFVPSGVGGGAVNYGTAGNFNGFSSYVHFGWSGHPEPFDLGTDEFTITGWFKSKVNMDNVNRALFYSGNIRHVDNPGWFFRVGRADRRYRGQLLFTVEGESVFSGDRVDDDEWHFVAVVRENDCVTMYIDGDDVDSGPLKGNASANVAVEAFFGRSGDLSFEGDLDDWRVYDVALDDDDLEALFEAASASTEK